jgi:hypothetical protein
MTVQRAAAVLLASLACGFAACDDDHDVRVRASVTGPTPFERRAPFGGPGITGVAIFPANIAFTAVPIFRCPTIAPFFSTVTLAIEERSGSDLFVDVVVFDFVDRFGFRSPLTFTRPDLTALFGSTLVVANTSRNFPFTTHFGCGFRSVPSQLFVDLTFVNRDGVRRGSALTASFP